MFLVQKRHCHVRRFPMSMGRRRRFPILSVRHVFSLLYQFQIPFHSTLAFWVIGCWHDYCRKYPRS
jgi:hypothetical protein